MTLLRGALLLTGVYPLSPIVRISAGSPIFLSNDKTISANGRGSNRCGAQIARRRRTVHDEGEHS